MIQRIQTVYLFLSALVISMTFFFPFVELLGNEAFYDFFYNGIYRAFPFGPELIIASLPLFILLAIIMLISIINIFLYKNRVLQMRLSVLNILLIIGSYVLGYYYIYAAFKGIDMVINFKLSSFLLLIAAILTYLAFRGIRKDEKLVRSLDRIR